MINIKKFVEIRKSLKLSQTELCDGICTQSTLSKFENNGRVPSFKIVQKLCSRMNITISDIMVPTIEADTEKALFDADLAFNTFQYTKVAKILKGIKKRQLTKAQEKFHYDYLAGQLALKVDHDEMGALYYFNGILTAPNMYPNDIYRLLALNGCSEVYASKGEADKAEHYFDQIMKYIMDVNINSNQLAMQVLSILFCVGNFYGEQGKYRYSNKLLKYAYKVCANNHIVFYLSRILFRLALNQQAENSDKKTVIESLHDAAAFARLNNNQIILDRVQQMLEDLK